MRACVRACALVHAIIHAACLQHAPWLIPIVNQVSGNSAPETLYRSKLFISSPEQYPITGCNNGICQPGVPITPECLRTGGCINASAGAAAQQAANEDNAFVDMRFGLDHWPLFNVGGGNGPLNWTNGTARTDARTHACARVCTCVRARM